MTKFRIPHWIRYGYTADLRLTHLTKKQLVANICHKIRFWFLLDSPWAVYKYKKSRKNIERLQKKLGINK